MKRFALKLSLFLLPFALWLGLPISVMVRGGELVPVDTVIARQRSSKPILFGPAYANEDKLYKYRATLARDPVVLALGSSRVMQLRADFFRRPQDFYNAGGAVTHVRHVRGFLESLPASARLRVVFLGLDAWLFNPTYVQHHDDGDARPYFHPENALNIIQRHWRTVYDDVLVRKKVSLAALAGAGDDAIGLNALLQRNGFRNDGSYRYGTRVDHPDSLDYWDPNFSDTQKRMRVGLEPLEAGDALAPAALDELAALLGYCQARGLRVVAFLPPFPPTIAAQLRASPKWAYLSRVAPALDAIFAAHGMAVWDFTDGSALGAGDDEFIDGLHGSEKTYARMLVTLAERAPELDAWYDVARLRARLAAATQLELARP